jgi:hypothetical protein
LNKNKVYIKNSALIFLAFCSVFYVRIVATTIKFSLLNLLHFGVIPVICLFVLAKTRIKDPKQLHLCTSFLVGLLILFLLTIVSALLNHAGLINAVVSFMMLGEPFMFLLAISCLPVTPRIFNKMKILLYYSAAINFLLAAMQKPLIDAGKINAGGFNGTDGCGGVFFVSGAGNYVSATVSIVFALYFWTSAKDKPQWLRVVIALLALWHVLFSDSKQLVLGYGVAWLLMILISSQDIMKTLKLLVGLMTAGSIGFWCVMNIEAFGAYTSWARPELYGTNGEAWYAKFYSIRAILSHYQSPLNWLLGLGPGHTVSRLGAWFLRDYAALLDPLGSTKTVIGQDSMDFVANFWLTSGSSLFSPIFGWCGIWGDLGILGLAAYLYLAYLTWHYFAWNDFLKMTMLSVFVVGWIFTQMEEPGYMLFIAFIIGLSWQERLLKSKNLI